MTCRGEILEAFIGLERRHGRDEFDLYEVVQEVLAAGTSYRESTIRTHVSSRLCANAPHNHGTVYSDSNEWTEVAIGGANGDA